jgi:hypothetical protein
MFQSHGHASHATGNGYYAGLHQANHATGHEDYAGLHQELHPIMEVLEQKTGLIHSESMEMTNDPRFFQGSVLNKRLAAFSSLSVVSGLMVGTSTAVISMKKDMDLDTFDGQLHFVSFGIMTLVLFANVIATYVGVAQVYHSYRLETAGPTGFEMATAYYLNPNIVSWRHIAVKSMLHSLPLFLISTGMRIAVNFDRVAIKPSGPSFWTARLIGFFCMAVYMAMGIVVWYLHQKHTAIFRENYGHAKERETPYLTHVRGMMSSKGRKSQRPLDV